MLLNFKQKTAILDYLTHASNWQNLFDMDFFTERDIRLGHSFKRRDVHIFENDRGTKSVLEHGPTGAKLYFKRLPFGGILFRDESNREGLISAMGTDLHEGELDKLRATEGAHILDVPYMDVCVHFTPTGEKTIYCEDLNTQVTLSAPLMRPKSALQVSHHFHAVSLSNEMAESLQLSNLSDAVKLVLSHDLNIDPSLKAINVLDEAAVNAAGAEFLTDRWDPAWKGPWQWRPRLKNELPKAEALQKTWNDSTEFDEKGCIAASSVFTIQREDDGYQLRTSLNSREAIWAQGSVLRWAMYNAKPVTAVPDRAEPQTLLHFMREGRTVKDHRGAEWKTAIVKHKMAYVVARNMRKAAREQFALQGGEFAAIHYEPAHCMLAIRADDLESAAEKLAYARREQAPQGNGASVTRLRPAH